MTADDRPDSPPGAIRANPGYALGMLARALQTSQAHDDPEVRARAERKVATWVSVFQGMLSGALQVGARTPVAGIPAWATLEVAQGGFATGQQLAGGPLLPHERDLLQSLPPVPAGTERAAIASHYLTDDGLAALREMLRSGRYRVNVPEEGALLVVAWLVDRGHGDEARAILDAIGPFLSRLRFSPIPDERPLQVTAQVHRQPVGQTVRELQQLRTPPEIAAEREAVLVWAPLYDRTVALFAETVTGPMPALRAGTEGAPLPGDAGLTAVEGGWPCQHYPEDWAERARAVLADYRRLRAQHQLCRAPDRPSENFPILRAALERCVADPAQLTGREVGSIRAILAAVAAKRGLPGSPSAEQYRAAQAAQASRPTPAELVAVLRSRLAGLPQDEGVSELDALLAPITPGEAAQHAVPAGSPFPPTLHRKLRRSLDAPLEELVTDGVIPSAEELARVTPQISAQIRAADIADEDLRRLYGAIYGAFRRRRSLLLLNLAHQVRLAELPWVAAIASHRGAQGAQEQSRQALAQIASLAITAFPAQILPNKLLQELRALAEGAGLTLPIVDELAADIFMGDFTEKYLRAAQAAGALLGGTLYERYYGIDYGYVRGIDDVTPSQHGAPTSKAFTRLCYERAGAAGHGAWSVARNGTVIEQEQILTTHNLAVLTQTLDLAGALTPPYAELARRCFAWICRRQQQAPVAWQPRLRMIKNTAYAWRQMVFFLALLPPAEVRAFVEWAYEHLARQESAFQERFAPALHGLARSAAGGTPGDSEQAAGHGRARRFLGWTVGRHWLLP